MTNQIPYIRVFLSSPGDVNEERKIALEIMEYLPNRPAFRDRVAFRVVAWDKPGAGAAMRATLTPQEAINRGLPKPEDCEIAIVIFWARMGTPFRDVDGTEYMSGTHWELMNALNSQKTETIIFRRRESPQIAMDDPRRDDKLAQYDRVMNFFKSDLFYAPDGTIRRGVNHYESVEEFRRNFEIFFEQLVQEVLQRYEGNDQPPPPPNPTLIAPDPAPRPSAPQASTVTSGSPPSISEIASVITPHVADDGSRRALIFETFSGEAVESSVNYSGAAQTFAVNLVSTLKNYDGNAAVIRLLETLKGRVGPSRQREIDDIINRLHG